MESQSGTLQSPFSSAGARRQGSALRFSPTAVRRSCAVSHAKLKMSCGGSALSMEWRHASPMTGSSCPLRRRRPGRSETGVRIDREGWNGLETVTPVTLALTHRQGGTVLDRLLGQVRPARGNVNVCVHYLSPRVHPRNSMVSRQCRYAQFLERSYLRCSAFRWIKCTTLGPFHPGSPPGASCGRLSGL